MVLDDLELLKEALLQVEPGAAIHTVSSGREVLEYLITATVATCPLCLS